jgi:hypothetical protein
MSIEESGRRSVRILRIAEPANLGNARHLEFLSLGDFWRKRALCFRGKILVAYHDDRVMEERIPDRLDILVVERFAKIATADFDAEIRMMGLEL